MIEYNDMKSFQHE